MSLVVILKKNLIIKEHKYMKMNGYVARFEKWVDGEKIEHVLPVYLESRDDFVDEKTIVWAIDKLNDLIKLKSKKL